MPPISATEEAAVQSAARAARRYLISAGAFRRSIESIAYSRETYTRALHTLEQRLVERRIVAADDSRARVTGPLPNPAAVDPWGVDPEQLPGLSRAVASCPGCFGDKRTVCPQCAGSTRVRCGGCGGSGRVYGQRGMKNCPDCRAKGDRKCLACRSGKVECQVCSASGRVESWLEIRRKVIGRVCIDSRTPASEVHEAVEAANDFDADPSTWRNERIADSGTIRESTTIPDSLRPPLDTHTERILTSRVQTFAGHVFRMKYATALASGLLVIVGQPPTLASSSDWAPLAARRRVLLWVSPTLFLGACGVAVSYHLRHPWFERYGSGALVLLFALLTAIGAIVACATGLLVSKARPKQLLWAAALATALFSVASSAIYSRTQPTVRTALAALQAGDRQQAKLAAQGLLELQLDREQGESILDNIHLDELREATSLAEQYRQLQATWHRAEARRTAVSLIQPRILGESERLFAEHRQADLEQLRLQMSELLPTPEQDRLAWQSALLHAETCDAEHNGACVVEQLAIAERHGAPSERIQQLRNQTTSGLKDALSTVAHQAKSAKTLEEQRAAVQDALRLSTELQRFPGEAPDPSPVVLGKQLLRIEHQIALHAQKEARQRAHKRAKPPSPQVQDEQTE